MDPAIYQAFDLANAAEFETFGCRAEFTYASTGETVQTTIIIRETTVKRPREEYESRITEQRLIFCLCREQIKCVAREDEILVLDAPEARPYGGRLFIIEGEESTVDPFMICAIMCEA